MVIDSRRSIGISLFTLNVCPRFMSKNDKIMKIHERKKDKIGEIKLMKIHCTYLSVSCCK